MDWGKWLFYSMSTLLVVLSLMPADQVEGCSCLDQSNNDMFCEADFVVKVKVKVVKIFPDKKRSYNSKIRYGLRIKNIFKMPSEHVNGKRRLYVWTPEQQALCGVRLELDKKYILAGRISGSLFTIFTCNWHKEWDKFNRHEKYRIRQIYGKGNNCDGGVPIIPGLPKFPLPSLPPLPDFDGDVLDLPDGFPDIISNGGTNQPKPSDGGGPKFPLPSLPPLPDFDGDVPDLPDGFPDIIINGGTNEPKPSDDGRPKFPLPSLPPLPDIDGDLPDLPDGFPDIISNGGTNQPKPSDGGGPKFPLPSLPPLPDIDGDLPDLPDGFPDIINNGGTNQPDLPDGFSDFSGVAAKLPDGFLDINSGVLKLPDLPRSSDDGGLEPPKLPGFPDFNGDVPELPDQPI